MFDDGPKAVNQHTIYSSMRETVQKTTDFESPGDWQAPGPLTRAPVVP
jgi:hypothetical protein